MSSTENTQQKIVSLCKRRGFVFQSSDIYGGLANVYDYGPLGAEMMKNIRNLWWKTFVYSRPDVVGMESQILMHPKVWEASGHVAGFNDPLIDCKACKNRFRADHLISEKLPDVDTDDYGYTGLEELVEKHKIVCPICGKFDWTDIRDFNLMFESKLGPSSDDQTTIYMRPETAQGMFVHFKNIMNTERKKIPFGIAQIGKAFRNEITKGNFIFRTLEFEQMELQYFIRESEWEKSFEDWRGQIEHWYNDVLGIDGAKFRWKPHHPDKLAHYAKKAEDYEYKFSWGFDEVSGLHYRTDFDLKTHQEHSGTDLGVFEEGEEKFIPHVMESTYGLNRNMYMILDNAYVEEEDRVVLKLDKEIAPYKVAVFPLLKNKEELVKKAREVFNMFVEAGISVAWDERGNIGKRYYSQDEIGTPFCVTIDFETLEKNSVTIRNRDTMDQKRVEINGLLKEII
jgi:glycyl-tRNA synthetase